MRRDRALRAEVLARLDDAAAEMHLPEAIDEHARRQRLARIEQPVREPEAVLRPARRPTASTASSPCGVHALAGIAVDAAIQHERRRRLRRVAHHEHLRHARRELVLASRARPSARRAPRRPSRRSPSSSAASSASSAGDAPSVSSCRNAISTGVRSRSNTRSSSMPLPTGAFSRKRVPTARPKNGSNTSADVNGRIVRVRRVAHRLRVAAGCAVQVEREPGRAARAVVGERDVRPLADGQRRRSVSIAIMFAGGECASETQSWPSSIVSR